MLKRVALAIGVLAALSGWVGAGTLTAASAPKAYVGLFKDDAVAVLDTVQNKVLTTFSVPKGPHGLVMTPEDVELLLGRSVTSLDPTGKRPMLDDGTTRDFGAFVLATGAEPVRLSLPGENGPAVTSPLGCAILPISEAADFCGRFRK